MLPFIQSQARFTDFALTLGEGHWKAHLVQYTFHYGGSHHCIDPVSGKRSRWHSQGLPCPELAMVDVVRERSTRKLADSGEPHAPKVVTVTPTDQERKITLSKAKANNGQQWKLAGHFFCTFERYFVWVEMIFPWKNSFWRSCECDSSSSVCLPREPLNLHTKLAQYSIPRRRPSRLNQSSHFLSLKKAQEILTFLHICLTNSLHFSG